MLAGSQVAYISEPLNVLHRPGRVTRDAVKHWYQYICDENASKFLAPFEELLGLSLSYVERDQVASLAQRFSAHGARFQNFLRRARTRTTRLLKDLVRVLSIPWFAKRPLTAKSSSRFVIPPRSPAASNASAGISDFNDLGRINPC
ncbi:MAG: hypothetical protein U0V48_00375 [Anaerolineales bacterium]